MLRPDSVKLADHGLFTAQPNGHTARLKSAWWPSPARSGMRLPDAVPLMSLLDESQLCQLQSPVFSTST